MSKFTVTLKQLREHKACISGYNKVVCALKNVPYVERKTYMRYKHDEPIPLTFILESNGLDDALWCLRCNDTEWARDSRLFAVWCARQVQHLMADERSIKVLDVAERFANGLATLKELGAARGAARDAAWASALAAAWASAWASAWAAAGAAAMAAAWAARVAAWDAQKEMFIKMCNGEADWQQVVA